MKTEQEVTKALSDAIELWGNCPEGSEQRIRAAIVVRSLSWVIYDDSPSPLLKHADGEDPNARQRTVPTD